MYYLKSNYYIRGILFLRLLFIFCFLCGVTLVQAQNAVTVKGTVTSPEGELLIGVSVTVKGDKNIGTVTDMDGHFLLRVPSAKTTLRFSYIGYRDCDVVVGDNKELLVEMTEDIHSLDELVVVGYGTQKKATLTGAVSSVNNSQIITSTNSNLQQNIAGKMAGVKVITNSSEPGAFKSHIDIRGMGEPLVVIDGVVSDMATFNRLSANEIESVSALKDASAAVYGMRAGNGVLLITTKNGKTTGKAKIEYSGTYGWSHQTDLPEMMNAFEWASMINEVGLARYANPKGTYTPEQLEVFRNTPDFDLYSQYIKDFVPQTNHTIGVSGSVGKNQEVNYFINGSYFNEEGMFKSGSMDYERFNFRTNLTAKLGYGLTANVNIGYIKDEKNAPFQDAWNQIKWMWFTPPVNRETNEPLTSIYANGNPDYPAYMGAELNPVINSDSENGGGYKKNKSDRTSIQTSLNWDIPFLKGLSAKFMYNYSRYNALYKGWNPAYTLYTYKDEQYIPKTYMSPSTLVQDVHWATTNGLQLSVNYKRQFGQHTIDVLGLFEQSQNRTEYQGAQRYYTFDLDELAAGNNDKTQVIGASFPDIIRRQGYVGRLNYNFAERYLLELAFRYDGSSMYTGSGQFGLFPGGSVGWRLSEESFFKSIKALSFIDNLKLRASYGVTADDGVAAYQWVSGYTYPSGYYYFGNDKMNAISDRGATNPKLTWIENKLMNFGLDWDMWNGLFGGTVETFVRNRTGIPARRNASIPGVTGMDLPQENLNSTRTSGWEITLTHSNKIGSVKYDFTGNFMYSNTKNIYTERAPSSSSYRNWRENVNNRNSGLWWAMEWGGVITPGMDISALPNEEGTFQNSILTPGDFYHTDLNGDGYVDGEDIYPFFHKGYPKIQYGFTINLEWNNFDINLHFMGAGKKNVVYSEFLKPPYAFDGSAGALKFHTDRWRQDESGNWIAGTYPRYRDNSYSFNYRDDTWRIMDASYLRLKSVEIGYTIPQRLTRKAGVSHARIFANGFNLLTFSKLKNMDPEYPGWDVDNPETGSDTNWGYVYPTSQNFNIGLNLTF